MPKKTSGRTVIKVDFEIHDDRIVNMLDSALRGGSNYWLKDVSAVNEEEDFYEEAPFNGGLIFTTVDGESAHLNPSSIRRGMQIMADNYARHMGDFIRENDDATTADVWLQCALLGRVVYG